MRLLLILLGWTFTGHAFEIPKGLNVTDRKEVVRIVGLNSAPKALTNPYPLGGYSGFEIGYSLEFINVREIRRLGCEPGSPGCRNDSYPEETEWRCTRLTIGKGLYQDLDMFFSFIPPFGNGRVTDFGGQLRWSFYEARFLPINVALIGNFNQLNLNDEFTHRNVGAEIITGVNVDNFALYFGGGWIYARGTFMGGNCEDCAIDENDPEINPLTGRVVHRLTQLHTVVGVSFHFQNLFAAAQIDRYHDAVYSLKLGLRY